MKKKQQKWMKLRHRVVRNIAFAVLYPYSRLKYGIRVTTFKEQGDRPYLILFNHQTAFDQFFVGMAFKGPVYYLASEDLFSNGFSSSLIRWLVAPIPIKKQATDVTAVKNCIRVAREGGTIALAPEGNRTYSGKTEYMNPAVVPLARKLGLPIVLYRIEGGYGVHPRWSDILRKGKMKAYVARVIEPEIYKNLSDEELFSIIEEGLCVDEGKADGEFLSNRNAEYLERAVYVCPYCGLSSFHSEKDVIECEKCGRRIRYGTDKRLSGIAFDFPFEFTTQWYDYQKDFVSALDLSTKTEQPLYEECVDVYEVELYKQKVLLKEKTKICLFGDRIEIKMGEEILCMSFGELSAISVLGKNKLNIYYNGKVYQVKGDKRFNALKYVNLCYRYKGIVKGEKDGKFLGL